MQVCNSYWLTRFVILRLLGFVYAVAFLVAAQQLVPLIAQGFTNKEIASHLNLSEQTVKNHIHRMLRRVGASDRLQVIDLTRSQGICF